MLSRHESLLDRATTSTGSREVERQRSSDPSWQPSRPARRESTCHSVARPPAPMLPIRTTLLPLSLLLLLTSNITPSAARARNLAAPDVTPAGNQTAQIASPAASVPAPAGGPVVVPSAGPPAADAGSRCCKLLAAAGLNTDPSSPGFLPLILVDTSGKAIPDPERIPASLCTCGSPGSDFDGTVWVEVRGSSSAREAAKKSFSIKMEKKESSSDEEDGAGLMGFPPGETFNLYGPENDRSMGMRNVLAMWASTAMNRYASRTRFCELVLVEDDKPLSKDHYWGLYVAMEKIERGMDRVDVKALKPNKDPAALDVTGGYLLRYEHGKTKDTTVAFTSTSDSGNGINAARQLPYILSYPNLKSGRWKTQSERAAVSAAGGAPDPGKAEVSDEALKKQKDMVLNYISNFMGNVELSFTRAASGQTSGNPVGSSDSSAPAMAGQWRSLVDEGAFVDYFLATEFSKNPDGYRGSVYMNKDRGGKLAMGPLWDYNEAFGICCGYPIQGYDKGGASNGSSGGSAISPEGWRYNICDEPKRCVADPVDGISFWYRLTMKDPSFKATVASRWLALRSGPLSDDSIRTLLATTTTKIHDAALRNYKRWTNVLASPAFADDETQFRWSVEELTKWTIAHANWMDSALRQ